MEWTDGYHETTLCFTNNIPQRDGGTHLAGFRAALTRVINSYAVNSGIAKKEKIQLSGEDCREGLTTVLSLKIQDPKSCVSTNSTTLALSFLTIRQKISVNDRSIFIPTGALKIKDSGRLAN